MTNILLTLIITYAVVAGLMFFLQRMMLYHPSRQIEEPSAYGLKGFSEHFAITGDGVRVQLWYHEAAPGMPTITYFHGNAFHLGGRAAIYDALAEKGLGVLALSYRGYGRSEGKPTEQGLYEDARTALAFLQDRGIAATRTLLYGESLGTGVAVQMATEHPVAGIILQSPYTAVEDRAAELYRFVPVRLMIHDKFRSIDKISSVKAPLLLLHGELDGIIPASHGKRLYEAANAPKKAYFFPGVHHNDFDSALISEHVLTFIRNHKLAE